MTVSTRGLRKQETILDAAEALFLRLGLQAATMGGLSKEAGVAKATLYGYFPDKDTVFAAVVDRFQKRLDAELRENLDGDAPVPDRIAAALVGKSLTVFRVLQGSPHADELLAGKKSLYQDRRNSEEQWVIDLLIPVLEPDYGRQAAELAWLLLACAGGISQRAQSEAELEAGIITIVSAVLTARKADR
ncbi:TetR family transcriptional regulator [Epibacterium sp. SM1979]|uniref:TetR family transcriptional regulator n=1 Tax=Tritonibacter litoralis TaxID=2662264 RepID=A0A843YLW8_9RHOB|nr:TetR/AcrR family transcriptional regulator [Tritonibacter litoralis]MQQ10179.1 TetR family transcriptional regulator [Tritonibacter litoralis]